jgi:hypothetical protein
MTYTTPNPPGTPDFTPAQLQPGQQIINETFSGSINGPGAVGYCGNVNAIFLQSVWSGANTHETMTVSWSLTNVAGSPVIAQDVYRFNPNAGVTIVDCLPVLAPWVYIQYTNVAGLNATCTTTITAALQSDRGTPVIPNGGVCISSIASLAHNTSQNAYGLYVAPGLYSYTIAAQNTVTSTTVTFQAYNPSISNWDILIQVSNPVLTTILSGQIVIGTAQTQLLLSNGNATTTWLVNCYLTGPQV